MSPPTIDLTPLRKTHALLSEAVLFWNEQQEGAQRWREWREMRNATSHADDEPKARAVAVPAASFAADASALLAALEAHLAA